MNEPKKKKRWSFGDLWSFSDLPSKDQVIHKLRQEVEALKLQKQLCESAKAREDLSPDFDRWHKEDQEQLATLKTQFAIVEGNWIAAREILCELLMVFPQVISYAKSEVLVGEKQLEGNKNAVILLSGLPEKIQAVLNRTDASPKQPSPVYAEPFDPEGHEELDPE